MCPLRARHLGCRAPVSQGFPFSRGHAGWSEEQIPREASERGESSQQRKTGSREEENCIARSWPLSDITREKDPGREGHRAHRRRTWYPAAAGRGLAGLRPRAPPPNIVTLAVWLQAVDSGDTIQSIEMSISLSGGRESGRGRCWRRRGGPAETWPRDSARGRGGRRRHRLPSAWGLLSETGSATGWAQQAPASHPQTRTCREPGQ